MKIKFDDEFERLLKENAKHPNPMVSRIPHEPGSVYFSQFSNPEDWPEVRSINLRFKWLARFVAWILNKFNK